MKLKIFVSLIISLIALAAQSAMPRQSAIATFESSKALKHATAGVCVMDLKTGKVVAGSNEDKGIVSASTMKVVTTATALEMLGKDFQYHTRVYAVGDLDKATGTLNGDIVIVGGGDPTLGSRFFKDRSSFVELVVARLKTMGITTVNGDILLDESAIPNQPVPGYWMLEDIPENYGTGYHAINFSDNQLRIRFTYNREDNSFTTTTVPDMPWITLRSNLHQHSKGDTANRPGIETSLFYDSKVIQMEGLVRERKRGKEDFSSWYANPAPGQLLADSIARAMNSHGITLARATCERPQSCDTLRVVDYASPVLTEIIESTLRRSDNMFAEALLRTLPIDSGLPATTPNGTRMVNSLWKSKGLSTDELSMKDGSGLARNGWTTPRFLCNVLRIAYRDFGSEYSDLLPIAGKEGTVKSLLRKTALEGKIRLKSGSMGGVQCYAGYYPAENPRYAVSIMVNNFTENRSSVIKQIQAALVNLLAE